MFFDEVNFFYDAIWEIMVIENYIPGLKYEN